MNHAGKFFVHYFSRDCAMLRGVLGDTLAHDCTQITDAMVPPRSDTTAFGHPSLRGMFLAGIRDYLAPGTERGSDASKLLPPRILTFTKRLLPKSAEDCLRGGHLRRARPEHRSRIVCPQRIVGLCH